MEGNKTNNTKRKGKKAMTGIIIALAVILILFGIGAVFCAPFSPVHKKIAEAQAAATATVNADKPQG